MQRQPKVDPEQVDLIASKLVVIEPQLGAKLAYNDYFTHLNSKAGNRIPTSVFDHIYDSLGRAKDSLLSVQELSTGYCLAVKSIQDRIETLRGQAQAHLKEVQNYKRKAIEAQSIEQHNEFGIMEGSLLVVDIHRATGLTRARTGEVPSPFVALICEGSSHKTKVKPRTMEPVWNESINFQIKHGTAQLLLALMNQDASISDNNMGSVSYPLSNLADQNKRDERLTLTSSTGEFAGDLHVSMRWIFNKVKVFEEMARQAKEKVQLCKDEIDMLKHKLNLLHMPFSIYGRFYDWIILEHPTIIQTERVVYGGLDSYTGARLGRRLPWRNLIFICLLLLLSVVTMSMIIRPDFPNLMIGVMMAMWFISEDMNYKNYKYMSLVLLVSMLYDAVWFYLFFPVTCK